MGESGGDPLRAYRAKREQPTPEPGTDAAPAGIGGADGERPRFVVHEHHASRLHWDLRLERDGVLVSFAVPHGLPPEPGTNHLAIRTEDHPLDYLGFHGEIPPGRYGAGTMTICDSGTYELLKWEPRKIEVRLDGHRYRARYALFPIGRSDAGDPQRDGAEWMVHRMDPPEDPSAGPLPERVAPMLARPGTLPHGEGWAFEVKWDGARVLAHSAPGRLTLRSRALNDVTRQYPEVAGPLGRGLGLHRAVLDGEVVAFDEDGRPSFAALQRRMHVTAEAKVRRLMRTQPVRYVVFDLLWLDGHDLTALGYDERRERLSALDLPRGGDAVMVPEPEDDGPALLEAAGRLGLEGVVAKRRDAPYLPGVRSSAFTKVKLTGRLEFAIAGWTPGTGRRQDHLGALLLGIPDPDSGGLRYAGRVGTGFTDADLAALRTALRARVRSDPPFTAPGGAAPPATSTFVEPDLRCEIEFTGWTKDGVLRHPSFKGLVAPEDPQPGTSGVEERRGVGATPAPSGSGGTLVRAAGRELRVTNLDKPLWPDGTTKGELIAYYAQIAEVLVPHLSGRPLTLRRWPDGVDGPTFYEKRAPAHRPSWVATAEVMRSDGVEAQLLVEEPATLAWLGNLAAIELHTPLHRVHGPVDGAAPDADLLAFDLDPGPPAGFAECCRVALYLRAMLDGLGLRTWVKSSGSKGLQVYAPLNGDGVPYARTRAFARAVAELLAVEEPGLVVARQAKAQRKGKVLVDWYQNDEAKTTVSVYSVRAAHDRPTVSAPLRWDEVQEEGGEAVFLPSPQDVLRRVERDGDLFEPVRTLVQPLPDLGAAG